ncbi:hypothetical protein CsSME_00030375 [Camellia sinensis var. sinensis]
MATMASRAKITRLLSKLTHKTPSLAFGFRSNGARGQIRVNPFGVSGFPLSSSAAPLESNVMGSKDYEDYKRSLSWLALLLFPLSPWPRFTGRLVINMGLSTPKLRY